MKPFLLGTALLLAPALLLAGGKVPVAVGPTSGIVYNNPTDNPNPNNTHPVQREIITTGGIQQAADLIAVGNYQGAIKQAAQDLHIHSDQVAGITPSLLNTPGVEGAVPIALDPKGRAIQISPALFDDSKSPKTRLFVVRVFNASPETYGAFQNKIQSIINDSDNRSKSDDEIKRLFQDAAAAMAIPSLAIGVLWIVEKKTPLMKAQELYHVMEHELRHQQQLAKLSPDQIRKLNESSPEAKAMRDALERQDHAAGGDTAMAQHYDSDFNRNASSLTADQLTQLKAFLNQIG